jgi:hypothetical protein
VLMRIRIWIRTDPDLWFDDQKLEKMYSCKKNFSFKNCNLLIP